MTKSQKLALKLSECRQTINRLNAKDELSDEERSELGTATTAYQETEVEWRAAVVAEDAAEAEAEAEHRNGSAAGNDGETVELRQLEGRASIGAIVEAALAGAETAGAERELQVHVGLAANQIPVELLRLPEDRAVTPAPATVGVQQRPIVQPVFASGAAAFMRIAMESAAVGEVVNVLLDTRPTVDALAKGTAVTETTGAFTAVTMAPTRLQARFSYGREDAARLQGMDMSLRAALNAAVTEKIDYEILRGTNGLLTGTNLPNNAATVAASFASYRSELAYGRVDGRWAMDTDELRVLMGSATFAHCANQYRGTDGSESALDSLKMATGGVRVSAHFPAVASNKQNTIVRLGGRRDAVHVLWQGISLVTDNLTRVDEGEVVLHAVALHAFRILRQGGFRKQEIQHA